MMRHAAKSKAAKLRNAAKASGGIMSEADLVYVHPRLRQIRDASCRGPWIGGLTEMLCLMDPAKDDIEGKLFNILAVLNIFSGLVVSGLLGYVLERAEPADGFNELAGVTNQEVANCQVLMSHVNLCVSTLIFSGTTFMCTLVLGETSQTILRCVSKARGLWVYILLTFIQMFCILAQMCLAALLNLEPLWAKITIGVDVGIFIILLAFSQCIMLGPNGMFPMVALDWLCILPVQLLQYLSSGFGLQRRIGEVLVAKAAKQWGFDDSADASAPTGSNTVGEKEEATEPYNQSRSSLVQEQQQEAELGAFLGSSIQELDLDRQTLLAEAMLAEGLSVETLVRTASKQHGFQILFEALNFGALELSRGERLDLINHVCEYSRRSEAPERRSDDLGATARTGNVMQWPGGIDAAEPPGESPNTIGKAMRLLAESQLEVVNLQLGQREREEVVKSMFDDFKKSESMALARLEECIKDVVRLQQEVESAKIKQEQQPSTDMCSGSKVTSLKTVDDARQLFEIGYEMVSKLQTKQLDAPAVQAPSSQLGGG